MRLAIITAALLAIAAPAWAGCDVDAVKQAKAACRALAEKKGQTPGWPITAWKKSGDIVVGTGVGICVWDGDGASMVDNGQAWAP
jgi:hypothetical protein